MGNFCLYPHCYYLEGAKNAAIYDMLNRRIFWIRGTERLAFLKLSALGHSIEEIAHEKDLDVESLRRYSDSLENLDLGAVFDRKKIVSKFRPFIHKHFEEKNGYTYPLSKITFELTSRCGNECCFCDPSVRVMTCDCVCGRYSDSESVKYDLHETLGFLANARPLMIEITGGDPYYDRGTLEDALVTSHALNLPVTVKTPGTLLCRQDIELLEKLDANLQLVFPDFSVDEQNSNLLLLQKILRWSGEVGYKSLQIVLLLADNNLDRMEAVHGWFKENNVPLSYTYGVLPKAALQLPDGERLNAYRIFVPQSSGSFAIGYEELQGKLGGHVCWQNQICIMANGDVRPCISAADKVFGNVAHKNILEIIRLSRMDDEVKKTQSGDKRCGKCEFSLGCTTCSITNAKAALADSKTWNCAYSPELGAFL